MTANAQFAWPPVFSSLAVSVQDLMAADKGNERLRPLLDRLPFVPFQRAWDEVRSNPT